MSQTFFEDLPGFTSFEEAFHPAHYHPAPEDWFVVVTDVKDSTKAIEQGRYKDVNMVGAACITSVVNACPNTVVPYVFGGDGATFLIPPAHLETVKEELLAVARFSQKMHDLTLRCGAVSMAEIRARERELGVAKYIFPTGAALAMFNGGGVSLADELVKQGPHFLFKDQCGSSAPSLDGLSCRWQPINAQRGTMLTLLVTATSPGQETEIYAQVNALITKILSADPCPVQDRGMSYKWPGIEALRQSQMVWRRENVLKNLLGHVFVISLFNIMNRFGLRLPGLNMPDYKQDMITNSDFRKFDDMLRMVVDCSDEQAREIETALREWHEQEQIVYGIHRSDTALMTCFVQSLQKDKHVHFIDGNDGGYALAAKQMKEQLALAPAQLATKHAV